MSKKEYSCIVECIVILDIHVSAKNEEEAKEEAQIKYYELIEEGLKGRDYEASENCKIVCREEE